MTEADVEAARKQNVTVFDAAREEAREKPEQKTLAPPARAWKGLRRAGDDWSADTAVPREVLERVARAMVTVPEGFTWHRRLERLMKERAAMVLEGEGAVDWGCGEALAIGSLLVENVKVRLSGQDTIRGTFSQRHAAVYDAQDGHPHVPLNHLEPGQAEIELVNSPLSEAGALGFEYGMSSADPRRLVVWEAQFGDFFNNAQAVVDQFIASAESKWQRMSGITLFLPHGYEGQGPEHSSARLERFLELCANGNLQVCNLTTPAQLFHALRRQLHRPFRKPLVIMSPKSLLRHKLAVSAVADFTAGGFRNVIDDARAPDPLAVRRLLLVSGKFYYTLLEAREARGITGAALVRTEQLYPFPRAEVAEVFARYPGARDIRWVQEEPANMGAWRCVRHRIESVLPPGASLRLVARKASPTPATGFYARHAAQEQALVDRALAEPGPPPARGAGVAPRS